MMTSFGIQQPWERSVRKMKLERLKLDRAGPDQCGKFSEKTIKRIILEEKEKQSFQVE